MSTIGRSWETAETKLLINVRQNMDHEFTSKKRNAPLWKKISEYVNSAGYQRTDKQCKEKWKNLLSEFKRAEMQRETEQRKFPYYELLKDFLYRHSLPKERLATLSYPTSPAPITGVPREYGPSAAGRSPSTRVPPLTNSPTSYGYSHPASAFSCHMIYPQGIRAPFYNHTSPTRESSGHSGSLSSDFKRRRLMIEGNSYGAFLTDIVELLHREVGERRRWEEKLERSRMESERRRERQERRRKRREKSRLERQKAQTLLLVAIASKVLPNISDLIRSANFDDVTSSESDNSE